MEQMNNNAVEAENTAQQDEQKTFTQDELNRIVSERLAKEKSKNEAFLVQKEQELAHREYQLKAEEVLKGKGLSTDLLDVIKAGDLETLQNSLEILDQHFNYSNPNKANVLPPSGEIVSRDGDYAIREAMGLK